MDRIFLTYSHKRQHLAIELNYSYNHYLMKFLFILSPKVIFFKGRNGEITWQNYNKGVGKAKVHASNVI